MCPHCGKTLDAGINEPLDDPLGKPGYFSCPFCKMPISSGKSEWEDKTQFQKSSYIFRGIITILFTSALALFFSIILFGAFPKVGEILGINDRLDSLAFIFYALCVVIGISFLVIHIMKTKITKSKRRKNSKTDRMS